MQSLIDLLLDNPLLLLFVVAAIGYALGKIRVAGISLGIAAVLFVGLAFGSLHPDLRLPEPIYELGLILFVYTVGLMSGRVFFASLRRKGLRDNLFILGLLLVALGMAWLAGSLLKLSPAMTAGLYSGSLTNTPALAGAIEYLRDHAPALVDEPVIAYSITYPMGVVGMILAVTLVQRWFKIDYLADAERATSSGVAPHRLDNATIHVTNPAVVGMSVRDLVANQQWEVVFGRYKRGDEVRLATAQTVLAKGDLISVIAPPQVLDAVIAVLGERSSDILWLDRSALDYRRIVISNPKVAGHRLRDLDLPQALGAVVTRLRRGDVEMLVHGDSVLELGDRVRVVARREDLPTVSEFFGDSYRRISEIDILTFTVGLVLGLLVGMIPVPLPGGVVLKLGFAGGPLLVALILGAVNRTGPFVWTLPYSANLTIRQIGLVMFLAGVGTRAGYRFVTMLQSNGGVSLFIAGTLISGWIALLTLIIGYRWLKIPMGLLLGLLAGLQTQPAVLAFAQEQTNNELPNIGYAAVFPLALMAKIILTQLLLAFLM